MRGDAGQQAAIENQALTNTQGDGMAVAELVKSLGLGYKLGLVVIVAGIVIAASGWLLGAVVGPAVPAMLEFLRAPDDPAIPPSNDSAAGTQLLHMLGVFIILSGVCVINLRLVADLLGLAGGASLTSQLASRLNTIEKLGLGATMIGLVVVFSIGAAQVILVEIYLYRYETGAAMTALETIWNAGFASALAGLGALTLGTPNRRALLLGWTNIVLWGRLGLGWINLLGLGLIALSALGAIVEIEQSYIVLGAGLAILAVGVIPHFLAN